MAGTFTITREELEGFGKKVMAFKDELTEKEQLLMQQLLKHAKTDMDAELAAKNDDGEGEGGEGGTDVQLFPWLERAMMASPLAVPTPVPNLGLAGIVSMPVGGEMREGAALAGARGE